MGPKLPKQSAAKLKLTLVSPKIASRKGMRDTLHILNMRNQTLSTHVWELKNKSICHTIVWEIIARSKGYNPSMGQCRLCLKEKYFILFKPAGAPLNAKSEFFSSSRQYNKLMRPS